MGNRDIGGRGINGATGTSVDTEIKMGKMYAVEEIEKSTKFINDPVVVEYVQYIRRSVQNIVKNSDCKDFRSPSRSSIPMKSMPWLCRADFSM